MASNLDILHAYRHLYRSLLRAVQYATPARLAARSQLRAAFRDRDAVWDAEGTKRTRWFLEAAAKERGLEHRILKNLLRVQRVRTERAPSFRKLYLDSQLKKPQRDDAAIASKHYEMTIAMLNKSMGLCLR